MEAGHLSFCFDLVFFPSSVGGGSRVRGRLYVFLYVHTHIRVEINFIHRDNNREGHFEKKKEKDRKQTVSHLGLLNLGERCRYVYLSKTREGCRDPNALAGTV